MRFLDLVSHGGMGIEKRTRPPNPAYLYDLQRVNLLLWWSSPCALNRVPGQGLYNPVVRSFTAYIEFDPATQLYVGTVPGIPGAHTQGATSDELRGNLKEVLELCLEESTGTSDDLPRVIGV